jgi:hypothetical protein
MKIINKKTKLAVLMAAIYGLSPNAFASLICDPGSTMYQVNGVSKCVVNPQYGQQVFVSVSGYTNGYYTSTTSCPSGYTESGGLCYNYTCPSGYAQTGSGTSTQCTSSVSVSTYWQNLSCNSGFSLVNPDVTSYDPRVSSASNYTCTQTIINYNTIPTITSGFNSLVSELLPFTITGSAQNTDGSSGDNGYPLNLEVNTNAGSAPINLTTPSSSATSTSFTMTGTGSKVRKVTNSVTDTYTVKATDSRGAWVQENYTLKTSFRDLIPTITLPVDNKTQNEQTTVDLVASALDIDNIDPLIIKWTQLAGSTVTINNSNSLNASIILPVRKVYDGNETFKFRVTVTDEDGNSVYKDITVTSIPVNAPPTIDQFPDEITVNEKTRFTIPTVSKDTDGFIANYSWAKTSGIPMAMDYTTNTDTYDGLTPVRRFRDGIGVSYYTLTVTDDEGGKASKTVKINIVPVNEIPIAVVKDLPANSIIEVPDSSNFTLDGTPSYDLDEDGSIIAYEWKQTNTSIPLLAFDSYQTAITGAKSPFRNALDGNLDIPVKLDVIDNDGAHGYKDFIVRVIPNNIPPVSVPGPDITVNELSEVILDGKASYDTDGTIAAYEWKIISGEATVIAENGNINAPMSNVKQVKLFTPSVLDNETTKTIVAQLKVTDNEGGTDTKNINITVSAKNNKPVVTIGANRTSNGSTKIYLTPVYSDSDGEVKKVEFYVESGEPLTINASEGVGTFTSPNPPEGEILKSVIVAKVTDNEDAVSYDKMEYAFYHADPVTYTMQLQQTIGVNKNIKTLTGVPLTQILTPVIADAENRSIRGILPVELYADADVIINGYTVNKNVMKLIDYDFTESGGILSMPVWSANNDEDKTINLKAVIPEINSRITIKNVNNVRKWSNNTFASSCEEYRHPDNASDFRYWGNTGSGTYRILTVNGSQNDVYCDMFTQGGGWTMITDNSTASATTSSQLSIDSTYINYKQIMIDGSATSMDFDNSSSGWKTSSGINLASRVYIDGTSKGLISNLGTIYADGSNSYYSFSGLLTYPVVNGYSSNPIGQGNISSIYHSSRNDRCLVGQVNIPMLCYEKIIFNTNGKISEITNLSSESGTGISNDSILAGYKVYVK